MEPLTAPTAAARTVTSHYYPDGTVKDQVDEAGKTTRYDYDQRGLPTRVDAPFTATRSLTTLYGYDADGNRTQLISPRGYDASTDKTTFNSFVTTLTYDPADQLAVTSLPTGTASNGQATPASYLYRAYDADGRLASSSLPVSVAPSDTDPTRPSSTLSAAAQTKVGYWDPGWVATQTTGPNPPVRFDYTAEGWQAERTPATAASQPSKTELWSYFPSGTLRARSDPEGHTATYTYDANSQLTTAVSNIGVTDPSQTTVTVGASYDGYGELTTTTSQLQGQSFKTISAYTYTNDGQMASRSDNGKEGSQTAPPDRVSLVYDDGDRLTDLYDFGTGTSCAGDQHITTSYQPTGWESQRVIARTAASCSGQDPAPPGSYATKQTTNWTYNDNGKLDTLQVRGASGQVLQTHTVGYDDPTGIYNNGIRTSDRFALNGPGSSQCTGSTPSCTASYVYDARDKLIAANDGHGTQTSYTLDGTPASCTPTDTTIRAGNITTETAVTAAATKTTSRCYAGSQQTTQTDPSGTTTKYWYDDLARLWCTTTTTVSDRSACNHSDGAPADTRLRQVNTYDYLDHLTGTRRYDTAGAKTDSATYVYDALDRIATERETHTQGSVADRTTTFTYLGLSNQSVAEHQSTVTVCAATDRPTLTGDKTYLYDATGHRITLGDRSASCASRLPPPFPTSYDYGQDVHGSVATLNKDANPGAATAVYAYTPYGTEDDQASQANQTDPSKVLSKGDALQQAIPNNGTTRNDNPLNPYRYAAKRYDTGSQTLDTGTRRFDLGSGRYLQQDFYRGALDDLGLSTDPLNQNRYALAAANPIGYTESDGHLSIPDGGGGSSPSPSPADFRKAEEQSSGRGAVPCGVACTETLPHGTNVTTVHTDLGKLTYVNGMYINPNLVYDIDRFASLFDEYYSDEFHSQIKDRGQRTASAMSAACETEVDVCTTFMASELNALNAKYAREARGCDDRCQRTADFIAGIGIQGGTIAAARLSSTFGRGGLKGTRYDTSVFDDILCMHSFRADTLVLMADGTRKPISKV